MDFGAAVIFSALNAAVGGTKAAMDIRKNFQQAPPFETRVLDSVSQEGFHVITFGLKNNTQHGIYVESLSISRPESREAHENFTIKEHGMGTGKAYQEPDTYFPVSLSAFNDKTFFVRFSILSPKRQHVNAPYMLADFTISRLDQKQEEAEVRQEFRIRWNTNDE